MCVCAQQQAKLPLHCSDLHELLKHGWIIVYLLHPAFSFSVSSLPSLPLPSFTPSLYGEIPWIGVPWASPLERGDELYLEPLLRPVQYEHRVTQIVSFVIVSTHISHCSNTNQTLDKWKKRLRDFLKKEQCAHWRVEFYLWHLFHSNYGSILSHTHTRTGNSCILLLSYFILQVTLLQTHSEHACARCVPSLNIRSLRPSPVSLE